MKNYFLVFTSTFVLFVNLSCRSQAQYKLSPAEFQQKISETAGAQLIDVRKPAEYSQGHLINAVNIDWTSDSFMNKISGIDKNKPVFVYCLSGVRSADAAAKMRQEGFLVYELEGGMMKWRNENMPEITDTRITSNGITKQQFDSLVNSDKLVLVDFYAEWCAPCKLMKPYLDEISQTMQDNVQVVRLNADQNQLIFKELKIDGLPSLHLYKDQQLIWSASGYLTKEEILQHLPR